MFLAIPYWYNVYANKGFWIEIWIDHSICISFGATTKKRPLAEENVIKGGPIIPGVVKNSTHFCNCSKCTEHTFIPTQKRIYIHMRSFWRLSPSMQAVSRTLYHCRSIFRCDIGGIIRMVISNHTSAICIMPKTNSVYPNNYAHCSCFWCGQLSANRTYILQDHYTGTSLIIHFVQ